MKWYVLRSDVNKKKIVWYNVFEHSSFLSGVKKAFKRNRENYEEFCKRVESEVMYYFWSKCEWEVVVVNWPGGEEWGSSKIDVYTQIMVNREIFMKYVWDYLSKNE